MRFGLVWFVLWGSYFPSLSDPLCFALTITRLTFYTQLCILVRLPHRHNCTLSIQNTQQLNWYAKWTSSICSHAVWYILVFPLIPIFTVPTRLDNWNFSVMYAVRYTLKPLWQRTHIYDTSSSSQSNLYTFWTSPCMWYVTTYRYTRRTFVWVTITCWWSNMLYVNSEPRLQV